MRVFKKLLVGIVALAVLAVTGSGLWLWQGLKTLETPPVVLDEPTLFSVEPGTAFGRVARELAAQGFVDDSLWLRIHGRLNPEQTLIKAGGDYEFTSGMTPPVHMINMMVEARSSSGPCSLSRAGPLRDAGSAGAHRQAHQADHRLDG